MGSCAAPSAKGDDKFITTDYLQQCQLLNAVTSLIPTLKFCSDLPAGKVLLPTPFVRCSDRQDRLHLPGSTM
ncbi:hypothetical protein DJ115_20895 [Salmonella enterica]|nr:hypothetical protein [Salmonella enterica]